MILKTDLLSKAPGSPYHKSTFLELAVVLRLDQGLSSLHSLCAISYFEDWNRRKPLWLNSLLLFLFWRQHFFSYPRLGLYSQYFHLHFTGTWTTGVHHNSRLCGTHLYSFIQSFTGPTHRRWRTRGWGTLLEIAVSGRTKLAFKASTQHSPWDGREEQASPSAQPWGG